MTCDDALCILENADRICNERVIDAENAVEEAFDAVDKLKTAIVIPEGATIGDVIKALFPNLEWTGACKDVDFYLLDGDTPYSAKLNTFRSWLNAPYERGEQK